jgi:DNA modification methylase
MKYPCLLTKKISEISGAKYNPRKISDEAMGRLTKSLAEFGNIQPITWNARTGNVVGGHQRLKVYKAMGKTEVDVWAVDLDEQKEKAANIALNKLSGEFDMPMLKDILEEIDTGDLDMEITGFGMDEIALMMEDAHPEVTEDEVPEVPVDAITKPGDLWILGEHRLLCGDSASIKDAEKLMNGKLADMVLTDPPYGVSYTGKTKDALKIENDDLSESELIGKCKSWFDVAESMSRDGAYWIATVPPGRLHSVFLNDWKGREILRQILVWNKDSMVMGHSEYHYKHEPILFGWKPGERLKNKDRTKTTVWDFKRPKASREHPTMKPIEMWCYAMGNHTKNGDLLYEPFCGSGTTIIAAEQLGRKCYGMEISPNYCDVIVKRWENLTGKKATLAK